MARPPSYDRETSFTDWSTTRPDEPLPGDELDSELDNIETALDGTQANLAKLQRDDDELANETVGIDQLKPELIDYIQMELATPGPEGPAAPEVPGPAGVAGPQGPSMPWLVGPGAPNDGTGVIGQLYLNTSNADVWQKQMIGWVLVGNLQAEVVGGGGGVTDHGALTGLADADHPISAVQGLQAALNNLASSITTVQNEAVSVYEQPGAPTTGMAVGDLWFDTDDGFRAYRWNGSVWVDISDARIAQAAADAASAIDQLSEIEGQLDGVVNTYYSATEPATAGVGDLWYETDTMRLWRYSGTAWQEIEDADAIAALAAAQSAQATADGKIVTFYATSAPAAEGVGDLWFDTDDNYRPYRWNGSAWSDITPIQGVINGQVGAPGLIDLSITGNKIAANTIAANKLYVQSRLLSFEGLQFSFNKTTNVLSWTAGVVGYVDDTGAVVTASISSGSATWTTGTLFVYWTKGATTLSTTTTRATAFGTNVALIATYQGGIRLTLVYGRTLIDGTELVTGSVLAGAIAAATITSDKLAANNIEADRLRAATFQMTYNGMTLDMSGQKLTFTDNVLMRVTGRQFGVGNAFTDWFGPYKSVSLVDESDAIFYLKTNGDAYFGGIVDNIAPGAVSNQDSDSASGPTSLATQNTEYTLATVDVVSVAGRAVQIVADVSATLGVSTGNDTCSIELLIYRGVTLLTSLVASFKWYDQSETGQSGSEVQNLLRQYIDTPGAGTFTYTVKAKRTTTNAVSSASVGYRSMFAQQVKA